MIRKQNIDNYVVDTIYNKTFEDEGITFVEPSLTDESYFTECDIYTILARGGVASRENEYGTQNFYTLDELTNAKEEFRRHFDKLTLEEKLKYNNNLMTYIKAVSDPRNYEEIDIPPELKDLTDESPVEEKKEESYILTLLLKNLKRFK